MNTLKKTGAPQGRNVAALVCCLGSARYCLPVEDVEEVFPGLLLENFPGSPVFVKGVVFVRGSFLTVVDTARALAMVGHEYPSDPQIVSIRSSGQRVALLFDAAEDLLDLAASTVLKDGPSVGQATLLKSIHELDGVVIRMLDLESILSLVTPGADQSQARENKP